MTQTLALVTGAPGWLGTRLVRALIKGLPDVPLLAEPQPDRRVRCLVLSGVNGSALRRIGERVEVVEGDLREPSSLRAFCKGSAGATLFHCAGLIHPTRGVKQLYEVNVEGVQDLIEAAELAGVKRLVSVSSNSPIGCNPYADHVFDEGSPFHPYMAYGRSKMLMEQAVREAGARGKIETVIVRPTWFYGPGQPPRQTQFFQMIRDGKCPIVGDGSNKRSLSYVDNTCQGLLFCERNERAKGQTYWLADRRPYSMNEIVDTIERLLETEFGQTVAHKRVHMPELASKVAWLCDWAIQALGLYNKKIHVLSEMNKTIACSIAKAEEELGYEPRIQLEEGMRRSIRWWLEGGDG